MRDRDRIQIGGRKFQLLPIRVREFIALESAAFDLDTEDDAERFEAYQKIARALGAVLAPSAYEHLCRVPVSTLMASLTLIWNYGLNKKRRRKKKSFEMISPPSEEESRAWKMSEEELLLPVYQLAFFTNSRLEDVLELSMEEFNRRWPICEALWSRLRIDLLELIDHPHLEKEYHREQLVERVMAPLVALQREDASPWHKHGEEAARYL